MELRGCKARASSAAVCKYPNQYRSTGVVCNLPPRSSHVCVHDASRLGVRPGVRFAAMTSVQCTICGAPFRESATVCVFCSTERPSAERPATKAKTVHVAGRDHDDMFTNFIDALLIEGNKIACIKQYCERYGVSLREGKDAIDEWERERRR